MAKLTLITLPIGNLDDLTLRVGQCLRDNRQFLAEDTRVFRSLLRHLKLDEKAYQIQSFHDHEQEKTSKLIEKMNGGENLFLVSDAGSPIISDPGFPLVKAAIENGHEVETLPGASAPITALELSGLPPSPFSFYGFLPREDGKKRKVFEGLKGRHTHIFFEGTSRMIQTLNLLEKEFGDFQLAVGRELTKLHQSIYRFKASDWSKYRDEMVEKGEFVLLIYNPKEANVSNNGELKKMAESYLNKGTPKSLAKLLAHILDGEVNEIYGKLPKKS